jgi:hypothetical protein
LAAATSHEFYRSALRASQAVHFNKTSRMFGNDVDVFGVERRTWRERVRMAIRQSPIAPFARQAKKTVTRLRPR